MFEISHRQQMQLLQFSLNVTLNHAIKSVLWYTIINTCTCRESCEKEIDRLHQEVKDKETQLSTETLKFDYEKEELQKLLTEQKQLVHEAKLEVGKAQGEMDRLIEEQEEEKNKLKKEMATLRDDVVR